MMMVTEDYAELLEYAITIDHENFRPDIKNRYLYTPLLKACAHGTLRCVQILIDDSRVDVNCQPRNYQNAIHYALCSSNCLEVCRILLQRPELKRDMLVGQGKPAVEVRPDLRDLLGK
jgi:ankyrin repeat protein